MKIMQTRLFFKKYTTEEGEDESLHVISTAIKTRQWPHGLNIEKMHVPGFTILSARLNEKQRVLFTLLPPSAEGEKTLLFLDYLPDHGYQRSLFLNPMYLRNFFSTQRLVEAQPVDVASDTLNADDAIFTELGIDLEAGSHEDTEYFTIETYTRPTISLSDEQREALSLTLPAVIKGVPGSGKTSVLEMILQQHETEEKMLYITKSPQLAAAAKFVVEDLGLIEKITVMTVDELYEQHGRHQHDLATARQQALNSAQNMLHRSKKSSILTPETLVKEFPLLAVLESKERYHDLGERQTALQDTNREIVSSCYEHFQQKHSDEAVLLYNPLVIQPQERWSLIAVDEAQDLDIKTLIDLFDLADNGGIVYSYDPNQNISDNLSSQIDNLTLLRSLIHKKQGLTLLEHVLSKTYRCPPAIAAQASLVRAVIGHIVEQHNRTDAGHRWDSKAMLSHIESAQTEQSAPVCWIDHHSKDNTRFDAAKALLKDSVQWAVITPEDQKEEARQLFNTSLVFSIDEIKGLEYKHIIMFNMMKDEAYTRIASFLTHSKHKKELTESTLHQKMNCLFTAMTRSMESLWIIEKEEHAKKPLFQALDKARGLSYTPRLSLQASTREEIFVEVDRLLSNDNSEQARTLYERHGLQDLGQTFETYCMAYQRADKEYSSTQLESFRSEKAMSLPKIGEKQVKVIAKTQEEALISEDDKKAQRDIIKKKFSMECLAKHLSDQAAFMRILTMTAGKHPCIAQLIVQSNDTQALEHFVRFCCDPRYQERLHLDLFALVVDDKTFLDYLALSEPGRTLITTFFYKIPNTSLLVTLKLLQQNGLAVIATKLMGKIKEQSQALERAGVHKAFKAKMKVLFKQVKEELEIKQSQSQQRKDSQSIQSLQALQQLNADLLYYARKGDTGAVKSLLNAGADVNIESTTGTPLICATSEGRTEVVTVLLEAGADINIATQQGISPLMLAAFRGHIDTVRLFLAHPNIDVNSLDKSGDTPLIAAAVNGHVDIVTVLLAADANIKSANIDGVTSLIAAARKGHVDIVRALLAAGADVNIESIDGTPLTCAIVEGHTEIVTALLEAGADINIATQQGISPLMLAAFRGYRETVRLFLADPNINVNSVDENGDTPLIAAALTGHLEIVRLLLAAGADVNIASKVARVTSLIAAAQKGHVDIVNVLLAAGADVNVASIDKATSLIAAAQKGHTAVVMILLGAGADVNLANTDGVTSLITAAENGHAAIVEFLLDAAGIKINFSSKDGFTALHLAAQNDHTAIVKLLLGASGIEINSENNDKDTPLHLAAFLGNTKIIKMLLAFSADCNIENKDKETALHLAVQEGHIEIVKALLQAGAAVNLANLDGQTPLICAAEKGHADIVNLLLATSVDANIADDNRETPLLWAAFKGHANIVTALLAVGADANLANTEGETPLSCAVKSGHKAIASLLEKGFLSAEGLTPSSLLLPSLSLPFKNAGGAKKSKKSKKG